MTTQENTYESEVILSIFPSIVVGACVSIINQQPFSLCLAYRFMSISNHSPIWETLLELHY